MQIGILQTGHAPEPVRAVAGDYSDMFERLLTPEGLSFRLWNVVDGEMPASPGEAEGWLITGSRHGVYEGHAWIAPLERFIRAAFEARLPVVGICFGHQIMAQALGGRVVKHEGGWRVGAIDYEIEGLAGPVRLNAWHQDQVVALPEGARITGRGPGCEAAVIAYGDLGLSFQGHPEFDRTTLARLIEARGDGVHPPDRLAQAQARLDLPLDSRPVARLIAAHFRAAHGTAPGPSEKTADAQRSFMA